MTYEPSVLQHPYQPLPGFACPGLRLHAHGVFTQDHLYSPTQLDAWRAFVQEPRDDAKPFTHQEFYNGKVVAPALAHELWEAMRLPNEGYQDARGVNWTFVGPSKYVMYAKVVPGQEFPIHTDTGAEYGPEGESKFTVLVYLNDNFTGGATRFYDDSFQPTVDITPECGKTLMFDIDLFHAGCPVLSGEKMWIGTEIVCIRQMKT